MTTELVTIPRAEWSSALTAFSLIHESWLVSLEIRSATAGTQQEISGMPLAGVTFEPAGGGAIVIAAGRAADAHLAHVVWTPTQLRFERTANGADAALAIDAADGTSTVLRFRAAALPEAVDGIAQWP